MVEMKDKYHNQIGEFNVLRYSFASDNTLPNGAIKIEELATKSQKKQPNVASHITKNINRMKNMIMDITATQTQMNSHTSSIPISQQ